MVRELAEFLLTAPKTCINLKMITGLMKTVKKDVEFERSPSTDSIH